MLLGALIVLIYPIPCMHSRPAGGVFTAASAERLLRCLALACPLLEELHVLPEPTCGLGDDQVEHLLALKALKVGCMPRAGTLVPSSMSLHCGGPSSIS
jgi:hypothetical protein